MVFYSGPGLVSTMTTARGIDAVSGSVILSESL